MSKIINIKHRLKNARIVLWYEVKVCFNLTDCRKSNPRNISDIFYYISNLSLLSFSSFYHCPKNWKVFMYSVYPSVCALPNSRKYSSYVLKITYFIYVLYSMDSIENGIHRTNGWSTEMEKNIPIQHNLWGEENFKAYFNIFILH